MPYKENNRRKFEFGSPFPNNGLFTSPKISHTSSGRGTVFNHTINAFFKSSSFPTPPPEEISAMKMDEQTKSIYTTRDEKMVSQKDDGFRVRTARFLNPSAKTLNQAFPIPKHTPLLSEIFSHDLQQWPTKVLFKGWKTPQKEWKNWVLQLSPKYSPIWKKSGIHEAIMSSVYETRPNQELVLGLSEFWCPDTNSFVFPWGEATITLEDISVLGGYPVLGKPVTSSINGVEKLVQEMENHRIEFSRSASHKAAHGGWLHHFMGSSNDDFEHLAFLCLWLSRFVFTSLPEKVIGKHVFPIAARLSEGTPMALAPAVLASIYKDLTFLRKEAITCSKSITITAPFQLVQLWAFERFPHLGPRTPNPFEQPVEVRATRWHKLSSKSSNLPMIRSAFRVEANFRWRPYADNLKNWRPPSYYQEKEQAFLDFSGLGKELRLFARCLEGCELVGLGFKELYLPHRVGRQFGFDQDIPAAHKFVFNGNLGQAKFFVPSRSFEPGVSASYFKWWNNSMIARNMTIKNSLELKIFMKYSRTSSVQRQANNGGSRGFLVERNTRNPKRKISEYDDARPDSVSMTRRKTFHSFDAKPWSPQTRLSSAISDSNEIFWRELSKNATPVNWTAKDVSDRKCVSAREVTRKVSDSPDPLDFVVLSKRIKLGKPKRASVKGTHQNREESKVKDSFNVFKKDGSSKNERLGLLQRMDRVEEIVGVKSE